MGQKKKKKSKEVNRLNFLLMNSVIQFVNTCYELKTVKKIRQILGTKNARLTPYASRNKIRKRIKTDRFSFGDSSFCFLSFDVGAVLDKSEKSDRAGRTRFNAKLILRFWVTCLARTYGNKLR